MVNIELNTTGEIRIGDILRTVDGEQFAMIIQYCDNYVAYDLKNGLFLKEIETAEEMLKVMNKNGYFLLGRNESITLSNSNEHC